MNRNFGKFISMRVFIKLFVGCIVACALISCSQQNNTLQTITLPMGYVANVQFSPFYMAQDRGYFQDSGFDVTFDYRWETDGIQLVAAGELPFTIASGDQVIQARSKGLPVKAIAAWYQKYPVAVITPQEITLEQPEDLRNLRIGIPETFGASYIGLRALLDAGGLTESDIDLQTIGYTQLALLTSGKIDAAVVYSNNEPVILSQQGYAYNILHVSDHADIVSAVIVSSDTYIIEHPDSASAFVAAFIHGLTDVLNDPDAAFGISTEYVEGLADNAQTQRGVLEASLDIWKTQLPGQLTEDSWDFAQTVMLNAGLIDTTLPAQDYYTNELLP